MDKLTSLQRETMEFLRAQIDDARQHTIDFEDIDKRTYENAKIADAQKGIVLYTRRKGYNSYIKKIRTYGSY